MKKGFLRLSALTSALFAISLTYANSDTAITDSEQPASWQFPLTQVDTAFKLSYENIKRASKQDDLGLLGTTFQFFPNHWLYGEVGAYSGVAGDLGGLFVFGAGAGISHPIYNRFHAEAGYFAGGGGAQHNSGDNNGFMDRSHIGINFDTSYLVLGLEYSYINFEDYNIHKGQAAFTVSVPGTLLFGTSSYQGKPLNNLGQLTSPSNNWYGFYRSFIGVTQQTYFIDNLDDSMQMLGIKAGTFVTDNGYVFFETAGAYDSGEDGYMDAFFGLGWQKPVASTTQLFIDGAVGTGGGGETSTSGGLMYKGQAGINYNVTPSLGFKVGGGYISASGGDFYGTTANIGVFYNFLNAAPRTSIPPERGNSTFQFTGWRMGIGSETYTSAQRESGTEEENIQLVSINIDRMLNRLFYVTGQAASAYGGNAGSYASGMFGVGVESQAWHRMHLGADILTGAAGGASMAVDRGGIYQGNVTTRIDLTKHVSLQGKVGQIGAYTGDLDSTTWSIGLLFSGTTVQENW